MRSSNNLEEKRFFQTHRRVQLVWMKVQDHSSSEAPLEYIQDHALLGNQGLQKLNLNKAVAHSQTC